MKATVVCNNAQFVTEANSQAAGWGRASAQTVASLEVARRAGYLSLSFFMKKRLSTKFGWSARTVRLVAYGWVQGYTKYTKYTKLQIYKNYKHMNYGNYRYYKIWSWFNFRNFLIPRKYFGIFGVLCIINRYFEYRIRILCIWLYMGTSVKCIFEHLFHHFLKTNSQKCEQFSYGPFCFRRSANK